MELLLVGRLSFGSSPGFTVFLVSMIKDLVFPVMTLTNKKFTTANYFPQSCIDYPILGDDRNKLLSPVLFEVGISSRNFKNSNSFMFRPS